MIQIRSLTLSPGGHEVLRGADVHLHPGEHIGLVGRNGTGKSTLLRAITKDLLPDDGQVVVRAGARIGYLPQGAVSGSTDTVWNEARSHMHRLNGLLSDVASAQKQVDDGAAGAVQRLANATEAARLGGAYRIEKAIGEVLHGLGFGPETWQRSCDTFSGGWQMRIALARMLLSEPDIALLDEPTNHLDLHARSWLAGFLNTVPWAFILVSHDRTVLDKCVTRVLEVRSKSIISYTGNYSRFLVQREMAAAQLASTHAKQQHQIAHLERFVERFGAKATKAAAARSKQKALDRIERVEAPVTEKVARVRLPEAPGCSQQTARLIGAELGWEEGNTIVSTKEFVLERGQRMAVVGVNGCGKSTLLHSLAGRLPLLAGRRRLGDHVRIGVFTQDLAAELPPEATALEHLMASAPGVLPQKLRAIVGALGLPGDMALRPIANLSGGEKARVALAALIATPSNVLLLDEPTNHLDVETVDVLADALVDWNGALLLVSHDRSLVERVATHVAVVRGGGIEVHEGVLPGDFEPEGRQQASTEESAGAQSHAERKRAQREREKLQRTIEKLEQRVEDLEEVIGEIDGELMEVATDFEKVRELDAKRREKAASLDATMNEWEEASARLEELA